MYRLAFFGLLVAITCIVAYGLFQHRIQKTENEVIETSMTLLNLVVANREKIKDYFCRGFRWLT